MNRLGSETSPYLLQHADNPVHWWPWGEEALAEAQRTNRPILLSVGYAACHWCHVMAHESFENPEIAAVMNRLFVNIKVDREERPDIDRIYMTALQATGEPGGWPLTMFLAPDGVPFWGGTYFPPTARYGRPGFTDVLEAVAKTFAEDPARIRQNGAAFRTELEEHAKAGVDLGPELLDTAARQLLTIIDPVKGGIKGAPKFPQGALFEVLWRAGERTGDGRFTEAILLTLHRIAQGGIYDHLGGGLARYSVDDIWLVPHFEKMLYDNAQLVALMTRAFRASGDPVFRARVEETIGWLGREMTHPDGGFFSSLDADSEGEEGRFYVWTKAEIDDVLGPEDGAFFARHYGVTEEGNWEEKVILNRLDRIGLADEATETRLAAMRSLLLDRRSARVRPGLDDKILADWNGLMIAALAEAATAFSRPDWLERAARAFRFIAAEMEREGRLGHSWREGRLLHPGFASDHAAMANAAIALHQANFDEAYLGAARRWLTVLDESYADEAGGFFMTAADAPGLIVRPRSVADDAMPSASGMAALAHARLWLISGAAAHRERADAILAATSGEIAGNIAATASLLNALDTLIQALDVVIVGPPGEARAFLVAAAREAMPTAGVLLVREDTADLPPSHPAAGKIAPGDRPAAYVCRGATCSLPVTEAEKVREMVGRTKPFGPGNNTLIGNT